MCVPQSFYDMKWGSTNGANGQGWYINLSYNRNVKVCVEKPCWSSENAIWTGQLGASGSNIELTNTENREIIQGTISSDFSIIDFGDFKWMELSSIPLTTSSPGEFQPNH